MPLEYLCVLGVVWMVGGYVWVLVHYYRRAAAAFRRAGREGEK